MRLFIAFDVDEDTHQYLMSLQTKIKQGSLTNYFHVTLKFLGDVDDSQVPRIINALRDLRAKSFSASLSNIGGFPSMNRTRVVWVGVDPREVIIRLQSEIDRLLSGFFERESNFEPHITIARVKPGACPKIRVVRKSFFVNTIKLVRSILRSKGSVYEDLAVFPLSALS